MKKNIYRFVALFTVINLVVEIFFPAISYALTSGPSQPEHVQFAPIGADNTVDLFSGDFSYNIPLFELPGPDGGYPFNLSYQAGVGVEDEASWVGLGWNISPGAINRQMRGLPDEFTGEGAYADKINQKLHKRDNITNSLSFGASLNKEFFGSELTGEGFKKIMELATPKGGLGIGLNLTFRNNSYTGIGYAISPSISGNLPLISGKLGNNLTTGLGLSASLGATLDSESGASINGGVNANLSVSGQPTQGEVTEEKGPESMFPSIEKSTTTHPSTYNNAGMGIGLGFSYNSRLGMTGVTFDVGLQGGKKYSERVMNITKHYNNKGENFITFGSEAAGKGNHGSAGVSGGSGGMLMSFNNTGAMPSIGIPMKVGTYSLTLKTGFSISGFYLAPNTSISQTKQQVAYGERDVQAYGYNHSEKNMQNKGIMDFNREKEGMIYPNSKTLPSPHFTYDTYMVTGQGMLGSFRPYRSEVFTLGDRKEESVTEQFGAGADVAISLNHFGANFDAVTGRSTSERMRLPYYDYKNAHSSNKTYEPVFYKFQGEASILSENALRDVGGNVPLRFELNKKGSPTKLVYSKAAAKLEEAEADKDITTGIADAQNVTNEGTALDGKDAKLNKIVYPERAARNRAIFPVENQYASAIPEYTVHYRESTDAPNLYKTLDRLETELDENENERYIYKPHHTAGFTCTSTNGMRYVYAMPVRNFEQKEVVKSKVFGGDGSSINHVSNTNSSGRNADNTEQLESEITTPEYATSHLLTSVLGNDYVDVDPQTNPGPSENDLGYWVKYSYERMAGTYNWRMPYSGANFTEGLRNTDFDDKISYIEGKKELVYLSQVETKTHIAKFIMSPRSDARGTGSSAIQQKLDKIEIYAKTDMSKPLKTVHFDYYSNATSLCQGLPNSSGGKLTLKRVWFTYQNITRGGISPYEFEYVNEYNGNSFDYDRDNQNAWGTYSTNNGVDGLSQTEHPYVNQEISEEQRNAESAAWSLNKITFPSGSSMRIEYESDDYAYVQDRKAMQMTKFILPQIEYGDNNSIVNVAPNMTTNNEHVISDASMIRKNIDENGLVSYVSTVAHPELRIYFPLAESHSNLSSLSEEAQAKIVNAYLDDRDQVYFKTQIGLREDKDYEDLEAFLDIQTTKKKDGEVEKFTRGLYPEQGTHTHGYFTLEATSQKGRNFHPLSAAAWIKLRSEHPRLLNKANDMNDTGRAITDADFDLREFLKVIRSLGAMSELFQNYFMMANRRDWGRNTKKDYNFVRLNNVKGKKYGGGIRVKRIEFNEKDGDRTAENTYGQVYEYTTKDENGREISSGVASFEPALAADENPLRYVEKFTNKVPALPSYPLFSEYPVNEGYYPSARVGYSKVTVKSIATAAKINKIQTGQGSYEGLNFPSGISTTGVTVNEFYTYKDYPVLAAQSDVTYKNKPSFSVGQGLKTTSSSGASQGYVIELNNMNGVPKSMAHYGQNDDGVVQDIPISSSKYFYKTTSRQGKNAVDNLCPVLTKEKNGRIEKENKLVGVEYEVFMDARESKTSTKQWGVNANVDIIEGVSWPMIGFGGTLKEMNEEVRSVVVNKVIYRSGVLDSVVVSDGLSISSTKNLLWDENTGGVLLTSVNNNFNDRIYSYTIPAYTQYDQMGAAYKNIGFKFSGTVSTANGGRMFNATIPVLLPRDIWIRELVAGDELLVWEENQNNGTKENMHRAIFMGYNRETNRAEFYIAPQAGDAESGSPMQGNVECMVYRSGRRNLLSASAGSINSLTDPTNKDSRETKIFSGKSILKK